MFHALPQQAFPLCSIHTGYFRPQLSPQAVRNRVPTQNGRENGYRYGFSPLAATHR